MKSTLTPWPATPCRAPARPCLLAMGLWGLLGASVLHAQPSTAPRQLDEVVVTATRTAQAVSDLVADVSIVDRETIEKSGAESVADVLARLPGIEIARNGGVGAVTSLYTRGAETRYTAVFIDGVRVDSQSTGGAPWEAVPLSMVDRIEVVRGPAAAVYGSDALAGVIQIFTRKGEAGAHPYVSAGVGNAKTYALAAGVSGAAQALDYAFSAAAEGSDGFDAIPDGINPDDDGYRRKSFQGKLGVQVNQQHRLQASALLSHLNSGYDGYMPDVDDRNKHRLHALNAAWLAQWTDRYSTRLSVGDSKARYESQPDGYRTDTDIRSYLLHNEYRLGIHQFTAALERREDTLQNAPIDNSHAQNALALGYALRTGPHSLQLNARHDDDSEFGHKTTGSVAYGFDLTAQWRVSASAGTAFRAPTLFQRFSEYGSRELKPEKSRNYEIGVRYAHADTTFSATAYRNRVIHQITYVSGAGACASAWGCYENTARALYRGITLAVGARAWDIHWRGSVDFQDPRDSTSDTLLPRRARRHATVGADKYLGAWNLGGEIQASSMRYDDAANTSRLGGYALLNVYAQWKIDKDWSAIARIDNLTDKDYALARTYATAGRTFYAGLRWSPSY